MQYQPQDLTECDKEQIQFIESIQPFGSLIAVDGGGTIVEAAIANDLGWKSQELIGQNINLILQDSARIFSAIVGRTEPTSPMLLRESKSRRWVSCVAHKVNDLVVVEVEVVPNEQIDIASLKFMSSRRESLESYLSYIAENMRAVTGYDRVMIYKFGLDWHGEVVAESLNSAGYSFYGHHFPASDIPQPARNLFTQMWIRIIPDVDATPIPLTGGGGKNLDLSRSILRAASPIHLQYLRNMDVAASMTMSLICDGRLWGLIACHHFSPKYLVAEQRAVCALLAKVVSSRITTLSVAASISATEKIATVSSALCEQLSGEDFVEAVRDSKHALQQFLKCDGFSFISSNWEMVSEAHSPSHDELSVIVKVLNESGQDILSTDSIEKTFPQLQSFNLQSAGLLAFKVGGNWFIWFRREIVRSVLWAGDPNKALYSHDKVQQLSPRLSFDAWKEEVRGMSLSWEQFELTAAERLKELLTDSLIRKKVLPRADAHQYLRLIRTSIDSQAAELQKQFSGLDLDRIQLD